MPPDGRWHAGSPAVADSRLVQNYTRQDLCFVRGEGCTLVDTDGRRFLDGFAGVAVASLGHAHPALCQAIAAQAGRVMHISNHYVIAEQERLARRLSQVAFDARVLFTNSGAEAIEAAVKAARLWGNVAHAGRKTRILAFEGGFHGRTTGALSITHNPGYREPFRPLQAVEFLPFGNPDAARLAIGRDVAAVFVEPVQGEGGVHVAPEGFLRLLRQLCTEVDALLIVDEVQTGMGRTGPLFACEHHDVVPDVMALAKGLGGGVPIGAMLCSSAVAELFTPGLHGSTLAGNPMACAAASVVLDTVTDPGFLENVCTQGALLRAGLAEIFGADAIRGAGLLAGVQLDGPPAAMVRAARDEGLLIGGSIPFGQGRRGVLRIAPPLIIDAATMQDLLARLRAAHDRATLDNTLRP